MTAEDSGLKKSIEQPETTLASAIPIDTAEAAITTHRAAARGNDLLLCINLVEGLPDFRGGPVFQLFTARQSLQDTVELREQLLIISGLDSSDHLERRRQPHRAAILIG